MRYPLIGIIIICLLVLITNKSKKQCIKHIDDFVSSGENETTQSNTNERAVHTWQDGNGNVYTNRGIGNMSIPDTNVVFSNTLQRRLGMSSA